MTHLLAFSTHTVFKKNLSAQILLRSKSRTYLGPFLKNYIGIVGSLKVESSVDKNTVKQMMPLTIKLVLLERVI